MSIPLPLPLEIVQSQNDQDGQIKTAETPYNQTQLN